MRSLYTTIAVAMLSAALGWFGHGATTAAVSKEPRFRQFTMAELNDSQRPLGEAIMKISAVGIAGPYNPMLRSPVFGLRPARLSALAQLGAAAAQRVRHSHHRPAVALAGDVVRP
jgi:hypothetical protein